MADSYEVDGVTVTPAAGGYYDLSHPSLPDGTERVQGKEKADARASEVAKAAQGDDEGTMQSNPHLSDGNTGAAAKTNEPTTDGVVQGSSDKRSAAEKAQERDAHDKGLMDGDPNQQQRDASADPKARGNHDDEIGELRRQLAEANERADALAAAGEKVATVIAEQPPLAAVPHDISRNYAGQMDKDSKAALKKAGIGVTTIVLEENESIPPTGLFIGHNGKSYVIKPGEEVDVPDFLLEVLDNAVMSAPVVDSSTQKILGYRNRSRYPYRVVKG